MNELTPIYILPDDVLKSIFAQFIVFRKGWTRVWYITKPWGNIMMVSKRFLRLGRLVFDPSAYRNKALRRATETG
jgi:hypothetical protein